MYLPVRHVAKYTLCQKYISKWCILKGWKHCLLKSTQVCKSTDSAKKNRICNLFLAFAESIFAESVNWRRKEDFKEVFWFSYVMYSNTNEILWERCKEVENLGYLRTFWVLGLASTWEKNRYIERWFIFYVPKYWIVGVPKKHVFCYIE